MTIVVIHPPKKSETCPIEPAIDYQLLPIGGSNLLLPQLTLLRLWNTDGTRFENRIAYGGCRAFQSESTFLPAADQPLKALPRRRVWPRTTRCRRKPRCRCCRRERFCRLSLRSKIDGQNCRGRGGRAVAASWRWYWPAAMQSARDRVTASSAIGTSTVVYRERVRV
jgi:hypothetical protein